MSGRVGWTISFEGEDYHESDLTLFMASQALTVAGGSWVDLHPLTSPDHLVGLLAAFLEAAGEQFGDACVRVAAVRLVDAVEMVRAGE